MKFLLRVVACLFLFVSLNSFGALSIRDLDGDWSNGHEGVYDSVLDITWLADANYADGTGFLNSGRFNWSEANVFAQDFVFGDFDAWRLPSILDHPPSQHYGYGYGSYQNETELNYIFQEVLNYNTGGPFSANFIDSESGIEHSINNAEYTGHTYWFQEASTSWVVGHYSYKPYGQEFLVSASQDFNFVWPVHDGDIGVSAVPLPAGIYLFLSGLVGLGLMRGGNA